MTKAIINNPILRGFNPDPNILKVGSTYYIVVSSFEWLPGIRLYTSQDLVNWQHQSDLLTTQIDLRGNPLNGSIWAPQLSYHDDQFYLVYTDVKSTKRPFKDAHNYLITAPTIEGPWSAPVYLNSSGFDPSFFHDEDGKTWLLNEIWDYRLATPNKSAGIVIQEYDQKTQSLIGKVSKIFAGTTLAKTEAPHLYRHNGYYYLLTAEGGTGKGHAVTVCRSQAILGPYELDPNYPMLTASDKPDAALQCSGHGSLVQTELGDWYLVYLCTRPLLGKAAILGRETAIQEVYWTDEGWLRLVSGGNGPEQQTTIKTSKPVLQLIDTNFRDEFNGKLAKEWNTLRLLADDSWCNTAKRPGYLRLTAGESIQSLFEHHLLAIRQKDFKFSATTTLDYQPRTYNQMAGLMLYLNDGNYLYAYLTFDETAGKVIRLIRCQDNMPTLSAIKIPVGEQEVSFKVEVDGPVGKFFYRESEKNHWQEIAEPQDLLFLAGGFTGNFVGIGVHDMDKKAGSYADFKYFEYCGWDNRK
ncbi:glycoside hydrolase family 43 protein [Vagococcus sp. BWB3-3]|uniref:Glycoside hydrolase family 43 protein n=1 Tax=Vagococcus allomyrinae TaxID=2794353 RepID=A0A940P9S2_9ENTE|nr:glycoside hydrolase family 43 protein [Vagococcus allomyrinae]MBP1043942.1 glycoside hydrolase family 43 protein [Vagococcus allomyrinae]